MWSSSFNVEGSVLRISGFRVLGIRGGGGGSGGLGVNGLANGSLCALWVLSTTSARTAC